MIQQAFDFYHELDPVPNVDGWPILGHGTVSSWIHRRYYPDAEEALADARLAADRTGVTIYVKPVPEGQRGYGMRWLCSTAPPFCGTTGAFYTPLPDHYMVTPMMTVFIQGEPAELVAKKQQRARTEFERSR